jgi:hypothetical protein
MTSDKAYLAKIDGETKEQRRRRLNKLSQQRRREKLKLLKPASRSNVKLGDKLPDKDLKAFQSAIDKLSEFIKTGAKVKELPAISEAIQQLPNRAKLITQINDCDEMEAKIVAVEEENKRLNPGKRKSFPSKDTVKKNMKNLATFYGKYSGKILDCTDLEWTRDTDKVLEFIDTEPTYKTESTRNGKRSVLASSLRNLKGYQREYKIYSILSTDVYANKIKPQIGENKLSDSQQKNYMDWKDIMKNIEKNQKKLSSEAKALIALYTEIPPRRVKDFALMKVILESNEEVTAKDIRDLDRDFNYLIVNEEGVPAELIWFNYKTKAVFGKQDYDLKGNDNKTLREALQNYIKDSKKKSGDFLFTKGKKGLPYGGAFSTFVSSTFNKATGKKVSANLLRHSYISHILKQGLSLNKREAIAKQMAHSIGVQATYQVIDDKDEDEFKDDLEDDIINLVDDDLVVEIEAFEMPVETTKTKKTEKPKKAQAKKKEKEPKAKDKKEEQAKAKPKPQNGRKRKKKESNK